MIIKLFEQEVPEVTRGVVSILSEAREPGFRTKIAVRSRPATSTRWSCVGMKGPGPERGPELRGERIDIIAWDEDAAKFVCNALQPAEIIRVLVNENEKTMEVIVPEEQLLLAIGKKGQNVKLASKLVGWNIEVRAEGQVEDALKRAGGLFSKKPEGEETAAAVEAVRVGGCGPGVEEAVPASEEAVRRRGSGPGVGGSGPGGGGSVPGGRE
jgi:N utilization substance protein A